MDQLRWVRLSGALHVLGHTLNAASGWLLSDELSYLQWVVQPNWANFDVSHPARWLWLTDAHGEQRMGAWRHIEENEFGFVFGTRLRFPAVVTTGVPEFGYVHVAVEERTDENAASGSPFRGAAVNQEILGDGVGPIHFGGVELTERGVILHLAMAESTSDHEDIHMIVVRVDGRKRNPRQGSIDEFGGISMCQSLLQEGEVHSAPTRVEVALPGGEPISVSIP